MKMVVVSIGNVDKDDLEAIAPTWSSDTGVTPLNSTKETTKLSPMLVNAISSVTGNRFLKKLFRKINGYYP